MTSLNEQQFSVKKLMNMPSADAMSYGGLGTDDTDKPMAEEYLPRTKRVYTPPSPSEAGQLPVNKNQDRVKHIAKYKLAQSEGREPAMHEEASRGYRHLYAHMAEMGERAHNLPPVEVRGGTVTQGHHRIAIANALGWHSLPVEGY